MKPILFNTEMVRAILDGRKTVTRRVVKLPKYIERQENGLYTLYAEDSGYFDQHFEEVVDYIKKPYKLGDVLYVRETWAKIEEFVNIGEHEIDPELKYLFKCDDNGKTHVMIEVGIDRWHPSIHMPKEAARIFLKVTDVRVERLQEIMEEQIFSEGTPYDKEEYSSWKSADSVCSDKRAFAYMRGCYRDLWNSTIKKQGLDAYGWDANPWVWVIEFERIEKGE